MPSNSKSARDNRANQLNPNNDAFWQSRGEPERPTKPAPTPAAEVTSGEKLGNSK